MHKKLILLIMICAANTAHADTETVEWYVDGSVYTTTTCQSGGDLSLPNQPTKPGHTFQGWLIPLYDFSQLDYTIGGNTYTYKNRTWATTFDYGVVSGVSLCSVTPGSFAKTGSPDETTTGDEAKYCWCRATGYTPAGENIVYENTSSSPWVFHYSYGSASSCASSCATYCSYNVLSNSAFRRAVFGA